MARERSPNRDKAKQMWLQSDGSMKLKDIAAALGLGESQIRKWKSQDIWSADLKGSVTNAKSNVTNKGGAPKGNKNATGHGAPRGNKNAAGNAGGSGGPPNNKKAVVTGEHESIWLDTLLEDERELIGRVQTDPILLLDEEISLLTIRERRMMQRVMKLMEGMTEKQRRVLHELHTVKEPITVHDEKSGKTRIEIIKRDQLVLTEMEETEFRPIEDILRIEEALTRVQDKKLKAIELKNRMLDEEKQVRIKTMRIELQQLQGGDGPTEDDGFIEALKGKAAEVWNDDVDETET